MKLLLISFAVLAISLAAAAPTADSLNVNVHYRAYCPHCKVFFHEQLLPAYEALGDGASAFNLQILPFTRDTYIDGKLSPTCGGGEGECKAETYASCILGNDYTTLQKVEFMECVESTDDAAIVSNVKQCVEQINASWDDIQKCYDDGEGFELLKKFNVIEHNYEGTIDHVPYVVVNGVVDENVDELGRTHFLETVCSYLTEKPEGCPQD